MKATLPFEPRVSIVIPVYNGANYLQRAINSALAQTYENVEVIVVNDGSDDDGATASIIQRMGTEIRSFSKPNGGCASALNLGISKARGEYISWLSHDDEYSPNKIAAQIEFLANSLNREVVLYGGYKTIDSESKVIGRVDPTKLIPPSLLSDDLYPLMRLVIHGCSLLIPRIAFSTVGPFNESLATTHDYELWFRIFRTFGLKYDGLMATRSRVHIQQETRKNPEVPHSGNVLLEGFLRNISKEEMIRMSGSEHAFLLEMAFFWRRSPYSRAAKTAQELGVEKIGMLSTSWIRCRLIITRVQLRCIARLGIQNPSMFFDWFCHQGYGKKILGNFRTFATILRIR